MLKILIFTHRANNYDDLQVEAYTTQGELFLSVWDRPPELIGAGLPLRRSYTSWQEAAQEGVAFAKAQGWYVVVSTALQQEIGYGH